jgi:hypothetical protein
LLLQFSIERRQEMLTESEIDTVEEVKTLYRLHHDSEIELPGSKLLKLIKQMTPPPQRALQDVRVPTVGHDQQRLDEFLPQHAQRATELCATAPGPKSVVANVICLVFV